MFCKRQMNTSSSMASLVIHPLVSLGFLFAKHTSAVSNAVQAHGMANGFLGEKKNSIQASRPLVLSCMSRALALASERPYKQNIFHSFAILMSMFLHFD